MSQRATIAGGGETIRLCDEGRIALRSFAYGFSVALPVPVYFIGETFSSFITDWWFSLGLLLVAFVQCSLFIKFCRLSNRRAGFNDYPVSADQRSQKRRVPSEVRCLQLAYPRGLDRESSLSKDSSELFIESLMFLKRMTTFA